MNDFGLMMFFAFFGGIFGASIGALWAFILCTLIAVIGCMSILAGGSDYILMGVALGPIFGPAAGGFIAGVVAATYSQGVRKNHPTGNAKDIGIPLMGTSWDVLVVGGLASMACFGLSLLLGKIPYIGVADCGAISIVVISLLARFLFQREGFFGKKESIETHGLFGTKNYELSWVGWMTPKPLLIVIGAGMGGFSAAIAFGLQSVLTPYLEMGAVSEAAARTVPLFFAWGVSGIMLAMLALGQGATARVPVTHAMSLVGALMFLHTGSLWAGVLGGVMGMAAQELGARLFWNHGSNHIDPPAFSIAVNTLVINIFFGFVWL